MKKILYINAIVIIILVCTAGASKIEKTDDEILNDIIYDRINVLNSYYHDDNELLQTENCLKTIEKGKLLKIDLSNLKKFTATDIDKILDAKIISYDYSYSSYGYVLGKIKIKYICKNNIKKYRMTLAYDIRFEKHKNKFFLTKFKNYEIWCLIKSNFGI